MRGYITFVLSVAILSIFLYLAATPHEVSLISALAVEKTYQQQQNAKELILEAAREGAEDGLRTYWAKAVLQKAFNRDEATAYAREGAYARMQTLDSQQSATVQFWCGSAEGASIEEMQAAMHLSGQAKRCSGCKPLAECEEFVQVELNAAATGGSVTLEAIPSWKRAVGISSYDNDYEVGAVGYVPPSERREFGIDAGAGND